MLNLRADIADMSKYLRFPDPTRNFLFLTMIIINNDVCFIL